MLVLFSRVVLGRTQIVLKSGQTKKINKKYNMYTLPWFKKTMALYSVFDMQVKIAGKIVLITKFRFAQIKLYISCNGTN
jgi:hypothetical protein